MTIAHVECFRKPEDVGDIEFDPAVIREKLLPKEVLAAGIPNRQAEWLNWILSREGKQYQADVDQALNEVKEVRNRMYNEYRKRRVCAVAKDGTFRLDDIPEGDCFLRVMIEDPGPQGGLRDTIGLLDDYEFQVPAVPGGISDDPLDIGVLEVEPHNGDKVFGLPATFRK